MLEIRATKQVQVAKPPADYKKPSLRYAARAWGFTSLEVQNL
jgi:hypothetical protein